MRFGLRILCLLAVVSGSVYGARPLLTVGFVGDPPVLDGRLEEEAWSRAVTVSGLMRMADGGAAPQRTEIAVIHDDRALYVGARCFESVLDPKQQRSHEFRANQAPSKVDGRVWHDDSIELFISPEPGGKPYTHFIINSRGARYDARGEDNSWNGQWEAAGTTNNQGWFDIEVRIPFSDFGTVPTSDRPWRVQFCRNRKPKDSTHCAWPPAPSGFHQPETFADLRFVHRVFPLVRLHGFVERPDTDEARVEAEGLAGATALVEAMAPAGTVAAALERTLGPAGCTFGDLRAAFAESIPAPGRYRVQATLHAPGETPHPLLITPEVPWMLGSYPGRLDVSVRGQVVWQGAVNGSVSAAGDRALKFRPGRNVVALLVRGDGDGSLRAALSVDGRELSPAGWRFHAGPVSDWQETTCDASGWPLVKAAENGWIRQPGSNVFVLRRTVTIPTRGYCSPDNEPTHLARGASQLLTFAFSGLHGASDLRFELVLPPYIALVDPVDRSRLPGFSALGHERVRLPNGWTRHVLDLSSRGRFVDGFGGELQWCEGENGDVGLFYDRVMRFGGSGEWQDVEVRVSAPPQAASARIWFLKWPRAGLSGLLEVDDVSLRKSGEATELIAHGDMEKAFRETWLVGSAKRCRDADGNHFIRMHAKPDAPQRQLWFRKQETVPVEGGEDYVFRCRARWRDIVQPVPEKGTYPLVVEVAGDAPEGPVGLSYGWASGQGATVMLDCDLRCLVGPSVTGCRPKEILLMNWPSWGYADPLGRLASEGQLQAVADQWERCGFNVVKPIPRQKRFSRGLASRFTVMSTIHWHNAGREQRGAVIDYLKKHEDVRATDFSGKLHASRACPTFLLSEEGAALREAALGRIRREARSVGADIYCTDYEVPVSSPPTICFDERCISGFREFSGLGEDVELNPRSLIEHHIDQWTDFQSRKNTEILRLVAEAVKEGRPGAKYMVYSGYHCDYTRKHYGIDWELLRPVVDIGSAGYGRPSASVEATVAALDGRPLVGGVLEYEKSTHPDTLRTRVLRRILDCRGGVMSWYGTVIDARWLRAFADASRVAAEFEDVILSGRRNDASVEVAGGVTSGDICSFDGRVRRLIVVFNESGVARRGAWSPVGQSATAEIREFPSNALVASRPVAVDIPPRSYRVFSLEKGD